MAQLDHTPERPSGFRPLEWLGSQLGRLAFSVLVPGILFLILWQGFIFLRDSEAPQIIIAVTAIVWGVGGAAALYFVSNLDRRTYGRRMDTATTTFCICRPGHGHPGLVSGNPHIADYLAQFI